MRPWILAAVGALVAQKGMSRKFLKFVTACEHLPLGGMQYLKPALVIEVDPHRDATKFPEASTCSNYLKIPAYPSLEVLEEKLAVALEEGGADFGIT